ncbi:formylglycine-generating enzyme family protein [soil metagenome]
MTRLCRIVIAFGAVAGAWSLSACDGRRQAGPAPGGAVAQAETSSVKPPDDVEIPDGMIYVPGGRTLIGSETGEPHERPVFEASVSAFFLDAHPVTVAQYRVFVEADAYVTEAERIGNGAVLDFGNARWRLVDGASWRHPLGPAQPAAEDDHPVTQVSWNDAAAYAAWAGTRLPTEVEWEHAARGGVNSRDRYSWGRELTENGRHRANTWQAGNRPTVPGEDGYLLTSPVGRFGRTPLGLADMGGNVWEWVSDWYRPYAQRYDDYTPTEVSERVQRGGSFLCHESYCHGYRVSARGHSTPDSSHFHVGFRTAQDIARVTTD